MPDTKKATQADKKSNDNNKSDKLKSAADFDKLVQEAEADRKTTKPGSSGGNSSSQHNNGRGGGK